MTVLSWEELKIGCFPHTVNIATQKVITAVGLQYKNRAPIANPPPTPGDGDGDNLDLSARNPLALVRAEIRGIRASGKRREEFRAVVDEGNKRGWWIVNEQPVQLKNRELILDVATRWDSTYQMDARALELRPVCLILSQKCYL
ncbi:hypothetical protein BDN72DRAFT_780444 [Pluteus cervinus]|uniref:Uncharacterized protein n=1 Tax=Pluteus cervinus TaxID=181527 RepID=A0ACD3A258_9AGAR|nr:hypothetical protein BDN72DRAFT_780444 [Pluteus cervinus]